MESYNNIAMPVMVIEAINLGEELAYMKATLDRILKETAEKDAQISIVFGTTSV